MKNNYLRLRSSLAMVSALLLAGCIVAPEPFSRDEILEQAIADQELIAQSQEQMETSITLAKATAHALKYNLEHRVSVMAEALAKDSFQLARYDMLPVLAAEAGAQGRSNLNAASSESFLTGLESLEPSFSEDIRRATASARFSWNVMDFGISYLRAKQDSDRFLIAQLARANSMRDLAQRVRIAYWRALALQKVQADVERLLASAAQARANLEEVREYQLRQPVETLERIRNLSEIIQQLEIMQASVNASMVDLAALMNVPPGTNIRLDIDTDLPPMPKLSIAMEQLENLALVNSPAFTTELYNVRIEAREARKSILRLLPGVEVFSAANFDTNSFLVFNQWNEIGTRVSWNLARLLSAKKVRESIKTKQMLVEARRLAANMATITQLYRSRVNYQNALTQLERAADIDELDKEIQNLTSQAAQSRAESETVSLRREVRALRSQIARMLAYATAQEAWGQFISTLNLNPVTMDYQSQSVEELASEIEIAYAKWRAGDFPAPLEEMYFANDDQPAEDSADNVDEEEARLIAANSTR